MKDQKGIRDRGGAAVNVLASTTIATLLLGLALWFCPDSFSSSNTYTSLDSGSTLAGEVAELR